MLLFLPYRGRVPEGNHDVQRGNGLSQVHALRWNGGRPESRI